jgi:hypothetical protein
LDGGMIDNFALALTHGLMLVALWRLLSNRGLDRDEDVAAGPAGPMTGPDDA